MKRRRAALMDALVRPAFATWRGAAASVAEDRAAAMMRRAAAAFANASRVAAFRRWLEFVGEARELRETLGESRRAVPRPVARLGVEPVVRVRGRSARRAPSGGVFARARSRRSAVGRVRRRDAGLREVLARGMRFWVNGASARAFERWCAFCEEASEQRAAMERAAGRFRNATAGAAYARWEEYVADSKLARRAMRFFVHRELAGAFNRWAEFAEESREGKAVLAKAAKWWRERSLVAAWLRWRDVCVDAGVARWAATFFVKRAMGAAFNTWIARVEEAGDVRHAPPRRRAVPPRRGRGRVGSVAQASRRFASRGVRLRFRLQGAGGVGAVARRVDEGHDRRAVFAKAAARCGHSARRSRSGVEFADAGAAFDFATRAGVLSAAASPRRGAVVGPPSTRDGPGALSHLNGSLVASAWRSWRGPRRERAALARHLPRRRGRGAARAGGGAAALLSMLAEEQRRLAGAFSRRDAQKAGAIGSRASSTPRRGRRAEHDAGARAARSGRGASRCGSATGAGRPRVARCARGARRDARRLARDLWDAADEHAARVALPRSARGPSRGSTRRAGLWRAARSARRASRGSHARGGGARGERVAARVGAVAGAGQAARLGRAFAALSHHWARKVLLRAFVYGRQKRTANEAWLSWEGHVSWARAARADRDKRDFSLARFPRSQAPWLAAGPGKKTRSPIASEKWKFY